MKLRFEVVPHLLKFRFEAGTSRGSFTEKETWLIKAYDQENPFVVGIGEASPLKGLSLDYSSDYEDQLRGTLDQIRGLVPPTDEDEVLASVSQYVPSDKPSMRFGLETALLDLMNGGMHKIFDTDFYQGLYRIPINGLVWMGDGAFMQAQIEEKLEAGFNTIKMKVGAIDFDQELKLLEEVRNRYSAHDITLRVDANGAFNPEEAEEKLTQLAALELHSIEQPIQPGQPEAMARLCASGILPIALDEELIGVDDVEEKKALIAALKPQFLILKPSLIGGIRSCQEWITIAEQHNLAWWMTSMLESNIGLNAIAQFASRYRPELPQGLGTGQLYHNNIDSPLEIRKGELLYNRPKTWATI